MIFNSLIKTKDQLTTLPEDATLAEALTVLENTGFRQDGDDFSRQHLQDAHLSA